MFKNTSKKSQNYENLKSKILTAKDISEILERKFSASQINQVFVDMSLAEKYGKGYKITKKGEKFGGIQKNYMGNFYVCWDEKILKNELFLKMLSNDEIKDKIIDEEEWNFREKFKAEYRTKSGHFVRSRAEVIIADWLYSEFICFAYEKMVPIKEDMYCDFYLPKEKIYIEFWGYEEDSKYLNRKNKKIKLYKENELNLIEIDNKTINNIDDFLPKEILKFKK